MLELGDKKISELYLGEKKVSEVYLGEKKIRPVGWFTPSSSTIAYYPLINKDLTDHSWNGRDITSISSNVVWDPKWSRFFSDSQCFVPEIEWYRTISFRVLFKGYISTMFAVWGERYVFWLDQNASWINLSISVTSTFIRSNIGSLATEKRYNFIFSWWGNVLKLYLDGVNILTHNNVRLNNDKITDLCYGRARAWYWLNWILSQFIFESKTRTDQEIASYYNSTKWQFWL